MAIGPDTVKHVATLARLQVSADEVTTYAQQLSNILELMEQLNSLPTETVEPMSHAIHLRMPEREDIVTNSNCRDALLKNTCDSEEGHFRVPKIIE